MTDNKSGSFLSNRTYDALKWVAQIFLPALGTLYFALGDLWNLPSVGKVVGTITVVDTFLGLLLKKSSDNYDNSDEKFDGSLDVVETKEDTRVSLGLDDGPETLKNKDEVLVKVNKETEPVDVEVYPTLKPTPKKRAPRKKA